jgi:hypothetical protein
MSQQPNSNQRCPGVLLMPELFASQPRPVRHVRRPAWSRLALARALGIIV